MDKSSLKKRRGLIILAVGLIGNNDEGSTSVLFVYGSLHILRASMQRYAEIVHPVGPWRHCHLLENLAIIKVVREAKSPYAVKRQEDSLASLRL